MINKINAVVLFVENLERCVAFYRDTLGLEVVFRDDVSFAFHLEGQDFAVVQRQAGVDMLNDEVLALHSGSRRAVMLCVDVENADAIYEALRAKGVTFIKPPIDQHWGWRTAYFADPEGNLWELRQAIPVQS